MQRELGVPCKGVRGYFQVSGGVNGGTLATVFNLYDSGQAERARDPFLLNPSGEHSKEEIERNQDPTLPQSLSATTKGSPVSFRLPASKGAASKAPAHAKNK